MTPATAIARLVDFCGKNVGSFDFQEVLISSIFGEIVQPGDTVVDGGAHTGRHTETLVALSGPTGRVYALEPLPTLAAGLTQTFKNRSNVTVIQKALSNEEGSTRFIFVKNNPSYSGMQATSQLTDAVQVELDVETTAIDTVLSASNACRLIKLDVEGAEFLALSGALTTLNKYAPLVLLENDLKHTAIRYGYSKEQFFDLFAQTGYKLFDIVGTEVTESFWESDEPRFDNFIAAKRPEDLDFVKNGLPGLMFSVLLEMCEVNAELTKSIVTVMNWIAAGEKVALFGAGNRARLILENYAIPFCYAVDNDPGKVGSTVCDIEVVAPETLKNEPCAMKVAIISLWGDEIKKQLLDMQIPSENILQITIR